MTTDEALDGARRLRWYVFSKPGAAIGYNHDTAIAQFWVENPYLMFPLAPEIYADDGTVYQAFLGGVVVYEPGSGCRVVH